MSRSPYVPIVEYRDRTSARKTSILDFFDAKYNYLRQEVKDVLLHKVSDADATALDLISYRYYQREDLWWIIAFFNQIINPVTEVYAGRVLRIPNLVEVNSVLNKQEQTQALGNSTLVTI